MNRREFFAKGAAAVALQPILATLAKAQNVTAAASEVHHESGEIDPVAPQPVLVPPPPTSSGAFEVGTRSQLFVDRTLVQFTGGVAFTLHPARKHPMNPLVKVTERWEGWRIPLYGTVLYDEEEHLFKMWYLADANRWFPNFAVYYATSRDGLVWEKPLVGAVKSPGLTQHNVVLDAGMIANVIKDNDDPDPARRYKMVARNHRSGTGGGPRGAKTLVSPDGIHWTRVSTKPPFFSDDVVNAFYYRRRKLFVAFPKLNTPVRGSMVRRCFGVCASADFREWSKPRLVFEPDLQDDAGTLARIEEVRQMLDVPDNPSLMRTEFYGLGAYEAESSILAFPWVFSINNQNRFDSNQEGPSEVQLASSRNLENWERHFRVPAVPRGRVGEWDCGFFTTASYAFRYNDEVRLYYSCGNYTHGTPALYMKDGKEAFYRGSDDGRGRHYTCSIGLASWPLDRFVSADGCPEGGILTTMPVQFSGRRLELNLNASRGQLNVTLLDAAQRPIGGYEMSDPMTSDSLRSTVTWRGNSDLSALAGRPASLRFDLRNAELYSFAFRA